MGFNSAFKGLKLKKKTPGNGRLNNLNDPVLSVLMGRGEMHTVFGGETRGKIPLVRQAYVG